MRSLLKVTQLELVEPEPFPSTLIPEGKTGWRRAQREGQGAVITARDEGDSDLHRVAPGAEVKVAKRAGAKVTLVLVEKGESGITCHSFKSLPRGLSSSLPCYPAVLAYVTPCSSYSLTGKSHGRTLLTSVYTCDICVNISLSWKLPHCVW